MESDYPRLLFFTYEIPQSRNAGSMQLFRTLQGYPGDRLRVMGPALAPGATGLPCVYTTRNLLMYRLTCTRFRRWVTGLQSTGLLSGTAVSNSSGLLGGFAPDLVVTVMDKLSYYEHAWRLASRLKAGLVTITMDDPQVFETAHPVFQGSYDRIVRRIYQSARLSLGVSDEMCTYLGQKFGRESTPFYFGPADGMKPRPAEESRTLRRPAGMVLGYAGTMSLGYREGILALLPSLESSGAKLNVYTGAPDIVEHPNVINRGFLDPADLWPTVQRECDALLLPYAPDGPMQRIYRTHFPTKLSEYCWSGMPLLLCGPKAATGIRWGARHPDAALVATDYSRDLVSPLIGRLRDDPALRVRLAAGAAAAGRGEFDPDEARRRFLGLIRAALN